MPSLKGEYPREIAHLVRLFGGSPGAAEKAIGASAGTFSGIAAGRQAFTEAMKGRVTAGIKEKEHGMTSEPHDKKGGNAIPSKCPPLLADLIQHCGTAKKAIELLGTSEGSFYSVRNGTRPMPPAWEVRARAEMGLSVLGHSAREEIEQQQHPEGSPPIPEFVPWDGKLVSWQTKWMHGNQRKVIKIPSLLAQLIDKCEGSRTKAAALMGHTPGYFQPFIDEPKKRFNEKQQRAVWNALHGVPPAIEQTMGEDYDKYSLGLAICMVPGGNFDRIHDIADILNGRLVFKKNTKAGGWLLIYKMSIDDLPKFKRLALRDANEIVCP